MRILMTGHDGYIGQVMSKFMVDAGHEVVGLDTFFFHSNPHAIPYSHEWVDGDIRDLVMEDFEGFDAVIHLAALSNDQMGDIRESLTEEINGKASVRLAQLAKEAGVKRFLFASSCSIYGAGNGDKMISEQFPVAPITAYARGKVMAEAGISSLADKDFTPVFLRNATVYGWSPRFRTDLIVNAMTCSAYTTGQIKVVGGGDVWRPLVHVEDVARAFLCALEAPAEISNQAINVGAISENYRVRSVAQIVKAVVPNSEIIDINKDVPDIRNYNVDFSTIYDILPNFKPQWDVWRGVEEIYQELQRWKPTKEEVESRDYVRLKQLRYLMDSRQVDKDLRWL